MVSFLALFLSLSFGALPPTTLKGNSETLKPTTFNIEVPNYQATTSASVTRRIETGNWNQLLNPSFEATAGTTSHSFGTTASISTTNLVEGKKSVELALTSFSGTIASQAVLPTGSLAGLNLESSVYARATMGSIEVCGTSNSTVIQCTDVPSGNIWSSVVTNMPGVAGGTIGYLMRTKNNVAVTGTLGIDDTYVGRARNLAEVSQASVIGTATQPGASNCNFLENTSSGSFVDLAAAGSCASAWVTTGQVTAVGATSHQVTVSNMAPGNYEVIVTGPFTTDTTGVCNFRFSDGTNTFGGLSVFNTANNSGGPLVGSITYTDTATRTFKIQAEDNHAGNCGISNASNRSIVWSFKRFPTQNEIVARSSDNNWYVDANISGANPSLGTAAVSSYTGITNSGLTLTPRTGSAPAGIACSSTNAAATPSTSATTCSAGDESVSASFDIPKAGVYEACFSFSTYTQVDSGGQISNGFQVTETATNAQTIITEGGTRVGQIILGMTIASGVNSAIATPAHVCGLFNWTSSGRKAVRLMYEQETQGNADSNLIVADAAAATGQRDVHITVRPWVSNQNAIAYVGSVTTTSTGLSRKEAAHFNGGAYSTACSSSPCTVSQNGNWISQVTRASAGSYTVFFQPGTFTSAPFCTVNATTANRTFVTTLNATSGSIGINSENPTPTATDIPGVIECFGAR